MPDTSQPPHPWGISEFERRFFSVEEQDGALVILGSSAAVPGIDSSWDSAVTGNGGILRVGSGVLLHDLRDAANLRTGASLSFPSYAHLLSIGHERLLAQVMVENEIDLYVVDTLDVHAPSVLGSQKLPKPVTSFSPGATIWLPEQRLLAVPRTAREDALEGPAYWDAFESELYLYSLDPVAGLIPIGSTSMTELFRQRDPEAVGPRTNGTIWDVHVIGDVVHYLSDAGVCAAPLTNLSAASCAAFPL